MSLNIIIPCVLLVIFSNFSVSPAQIPLNISLGSSIIAGSNTTWRSPSGEFAFGFYSLPSDLYLVGIMLDNKPERTLVWSANRDTPAEAGSEVRLTYGGQLLLTYLNSSVQSIYSGAAASLGFVLDNGNFVLRDSNSVVIWQSFDSPTDTLLPGQVLVEGQKLYSNSKGTTNHSSGNFMLEMQTDGNLVLSAYHFSDPGYWFTGTLIENVSLVFNTSAFMYLVNGIGDVIHSLTTNMSTPVEDYYHRAMIDDHGNFQQYVYHKTNGSTWTRVWRAIDEPCFVNSVCGVYGICSSPDNETVTCDCLPGYVPFDPNDVSKGCHPKTAVNYCADPSMRNYTVEVIEDADFPFQGFSDLSRVLNVDLEGCVKALMEDCYSSAGALVGSTCNKKRMPLLNARKTMSTKGGKALIKVPMKITSESDLPKGQKRKKINFRVFLEIGLIVSGSLAALFGGVAIYYHPATRRLIARKHSLNTNSIGISFRQFTHQELNEATNGFSKTLGRGSSGKVYSGILISKHDRIEIAVKKLLRKIEESDMEFVTELKIISRTHHKNLVRLLGFCIENDQRLLVYELMTNGTLSDFLFNEESRPSWIHRSEMALGIARGLLYLHEECETQIIHCDIKPQNVLLDYNYIAKIADFGLSKLLNKNQTRTDTELRGTMGYLAPEWLKNAPVTAKVDVYSFGVMLLEIICGRRHIELNRVEEESEEVDLVLSDWVISCVMSRKLEMLVRHDPEVLADIKQFERMMMVGLWCIHPDPILRPSMKKVTQMLEGTLDVGIPPLLNDQML